MDLQLIQNLRIGKAERRWENGREYFVAPITSIVPGVLPGSKGPLLYLPEDIQANVRDWDGVPLTAYHPTNLDGSPASAHEPGVAERQWIGEVRDSRFSNKLTHRGWFDVQKTKAIDPRIYNALLHGHPIETSTGLYTDQVSAAAGSNWKGRSYTHYAKNHRPDHLAILPDQVGACSINDGCGVLVNHTKNCSCGGTCTKCQTKKGKPSLDDLAINPAVSEAQRRYLNSQFGHDWVKEHHFDNHGQLPEKIDVGGEDDSSRDDDEPTENAMLIPFGLLLNDKMPSADGDAPRRRMPDADEEEEDDDEDRPQFSERETAGAGLGSRFAASTDNSRSDANRERCPECGGEMTDGECDDCGYVENANPEGINQYTGSAGKRGQVLHQWSKDADAKSKAVSGGAKEGHASAAQSNSYAATQMATKGNHKDAAGFHDAAAKSHLNAAKEAKGGWFGKTDWKKVQDHEAAAHAHKFAAGHHRELAEETRNNRRDSSMSIHNEHVGHYFGDKGLLGSEKAEAASTHANRIKSKGAHGRAAAAHKAAYKSHAAEAKRLGKSDLAGLEHGAKANYHKAMAGSHTKKAGKAIRNTKETTVAFDRQQAIDFIVANCDCTKSGGPEATKATLNEKEDGYLLQMKSKLLSHIVSNAKAEGSFADTSGNGGRGVQAGDTADGDDDEITYEEDEDDALEDGDGESTEDAFTGNEYNEGRQPMTYNEWMRLAPPEVREAVRNSNKVVNKQRQQIANQLLAIANNDADPQRKQFIINKLKTNPSLERLEELLLLVRPVHNGFAFSLGETLEESEPLYLGGAGGPEFVGNRADADDVLEEVTTNWAEDPNRVRQRTA